MQFDFALLLVLATAICGVVWFYDKAVLAPKRRACLESAESQASGPLPEDVVAKINHEPGWVDTGRSMFPSAICCVGAAFVPGGAIPDSIRFHAANLADR